MKNILVLHNNNLPKSILDLRKGCSSNDYIFTCIPISQPNASADSLDSFISDVLLRELNDKVFDLVILPYSFNRDNVLTYDGLICAYHLRLDERFNNTRTPFLFLGPDHPMEVLKVESVSSILYSDKVYHSSLSNATALINLLNNKTYLFEQMSDNEYYHTVNTISIPAPNNFGDSKHAFTNLWSLIRWYDMIAWNENEKPTLSQETLEFKDSLYFKWSETLLRTKFGENRQQWSKKKKKEPSIPFINNKTILHIDDEGSKGWYSLFDSIFKSSKAIYKPFLDFRQNEDRNVFIQRVKDFIDSIPNVDCYIIDLRMHESDVNEKDYNNLTGHEIAKYIFEKNCGNQVILFSASDKIWNLKKSEQYITDYSLKENPSRFLTREESYLLFASFTKSIMAACQQSYLRSYAEKSKNYYLLQDFSLLLRKDVGEGNQLYIRPAALNLIVFIESYIKDRFEFRPGNSNIIRKIEDDSDVCHMDHLFCQYGPDKTINDIIELSPSQLHPGWNPIRSNDLGLMIAVLYKCYSIMKDDLLKVIELKNIRNTSIAHVGQETSIKIDFLRHIFESVVLKMLSQA